MIAHSSNIYQALECFGVGLLVVLGFAVFFAALYFIGKRIERPVDAWFLRHPRISKWTPRVMSMLAVCGLAWVVFYLGCSILEACR